MSIIVTAFAGMTHLPGARPSFSAWQALIAFTLLIFLVLGLSAILISRSANRYDGKTMRQWYDELFMPEARHKRAMAMISGNIGSAAIPFLIEKVQTKESVVKSEYARMRSKLPWLCQVFTPYVRLPELDREIAMTALGELGSGAASAIPSLIQACRDKSPNIRMVASRALSQIAPGTEKEAEVIQVLIHLTRDRDSRVRLDAFYSFSGFPERTELILPVIKAHLGDKDPAVQQAISQVMMAWDYARARKAEGNPLARPQP